MATPTCASAHGKWLAPYRSNDRPLPIEPAGLMRSSIMSRLSVSYYAHCSTPSHESSASEVAHGSDGMENGQHPIRGYRIKPQPKQAVANQERVCDVG